MENTDDKVQDPLYPEAVELARKSGRVTVSAVQRMLRIGYNRAARLCDAMEEAGVISAMTPTGFREFIEPTTTGDNDAAC